MCNTDWRIVPVQQILFQVPSDSGFHKLDDRFLSSHADFHHVTQSLQSTSVLHLLPYLCNIQWINYWNCVSTLRGTGYTEDTIKPTSTTKKKKHQDFQIPKLWKNCVTQKLYSCGVIFYNKNQQINVLQKCHFKPSAHIICNKQIL